MMEQRSQMLRQMRLSKSDREREVSLSQIATLCMKKGCRHDSKSSLSNLLWVIIVPKVFEIISWQCLGQH